MPGSVIRNIKAVAVIIQPVSALFKVSAPTQPGCVNGAATTGALAGYWYGTYTESARRCDDLRRGRRRCSGCVRRGNAYRRLSQHLLARKDCGYPN